MSNQFQQKKLIEEIYKAKDSCRKEAAKLPIEEKVKRLVSMQRAYNGFNKKGEKKWRVWEI